MDKFYSIKELINNCPKCFICQKQLRIYYNFYINYSEQEDIIFNGLGQRTWELKVQKDELVCKTWSFDIETGEVKKNIPQFNKTLLPDRVPSLKLKCSTCHVGKIYYLQFNWIKTYNCFPNSKLSLQYGTFQLTNNLLVQILKSDVSDYISIHNIKDGRVIQTIKNINFDDEFSFKKLKRKLKMLLTFV